MRILNIIPEITVASGGPVTTMNHITEIFVSSGHSVHALAVERPGKMVPINGNLTSAPPSFPSRFGNSNAAANWLAESFLQFDVVFIHGVWTAINMRSSLFLRNKQRPYVVIPHGSLDPFDLRKKSLLKMILGPLIIRKCIQGSSAVLCSAQREADSLVTYGAKCRRMVLPWPVPPVPCSCDREAARRHFGLNGKEFVILSLGRVDYKKGFPVLLPAVQRLAKSGIQTKLLVVGPDSRGYSAVVRKMANELGMDEITRFLPAVVGDEKACLMKAADCFALPSLNENFGYTVIEAMQQGAPCVISNNVYICDELERGGAALVCKYNEDELFEALRRLPENPELRAKMSAAAVRMAKMFEPNVLQARYVEMLEVVQHGY
jgi:glycosyltransferase involved in cell wall biosynthesis